MFPPGSLEAVIYEIHRTAEALKCRCDSLSQGENACGVIITSHKGPFPIPLAKCCLFVLIKQLLELRISMNSTEPAFPHSLCWPRYPHHQRDSHNLPHLSLCTATYATNKYFLSIYLAVGTIQRKRYRRLK